MTIPDFNVAFKAAYGRLFPFGLIRLLRAGKWIKIIRVISMGVLQDSRNRGIDLSFYCHTFINGKRKGYEVAELSWVEEDNVVMTNTAAKIGAIPYREYRVYEYTL